MLYGGACDGKLPFYQYHSSDICRRNSITCIAPTKTFNLAGLQTAAVAVPDEALRHKVNRALNTDEAAEPSAFAIVAAVAAYTKGDPWLGELRKYLYKNKMYVKAFLDSKLPEISVLSSEATYLLWLDCRKLIGNSSELCRFIRSESGLYLSDGNSFGNGAGFLRMNIACPKSRIEDGMARLKISVEKYSEWAVSQC